MSTLDPLVSVVVPAYNRAAHIDRSLKSIQGQTYQNWEVILVDDGSQDDTAEITAKFASEDKRIHFIQHEHNKGAQAARNTGIRAAHGEWIAFLDSDDQWLPESLAFRLQLAYRENFPVVHSEGYIQHDGKPLQRYYVPAWTGRVYRKVLAKEGPMFPTLLVRKEAIERINYLDETIVAYQEWDTAIRLAKHYPFGFEPRPTFIYDYTTPNAISRDSIRNARGYTRVFHKHFQEILFYTGPKTVGYHYEVLAKWYSEGGDIATAKRCRLKALIWKCLSPAIIFRKLQHVVLHPS